MKPLPLPAWGSRTYVMGILNLTPDSFSGDGLARQGDLVKAAVEQAHRMAAAGADMLDLGAESSRPGSQPLNAEEEQRRLLPALEAVLKADLGVIISVDTCKASTARAALRAGAHWLNDIWGFKADVDMAAVAAEFGAPSVLMHNRSAAPRLEKNIGGHYEETQYADLIGEICMGLMESAELALKAGLPHHKIILDPGIGFGKDPAQNLEIIARLHDFHALGYPLLVGPSRKSFIGRVLDLPPEERLEGTLAAIALSIRGGADIVPVHDVQAAVRAARVADAITRRK